MKKLVISLVVLSLFTVGCQAFKDSYDGLEVGEDSQMPADNGGSVSGDTTVAVCQAIAGVKVVKSEDSGVVKETSLSTLDDKIVAEAVAEKITDDTVKVTISAEGKEELIMTIKKNSDKEFVACGISHEGKAVTSGEIMIDSFNEGDDIVNAASFSFDAGVDTTAVGALKALTKVDEDAKIDGSYYTKGYKKEGTE